MRPSDRSSMIRRKMPETYEAWLAQALRAERQAEENGRSLTRVTVKPAEFIAYCARHKRWPATESLLDYARECARALQRG